MYVTSVGVGEIVARSVAARVRDFEEVHGAVAVSGARTLTSFARSAVDNDDDETSSWESVGSNLDFHARTSDKVAVSVILSYRANAGGTTNASSRSSRVVAIRLC